MVDAALTLVAFVATQNHTALIGAGLIPALLNVLHIKSPRRETYIPRATGLLEALNTPTSPVISNANGVNVLVQAVKTEIDDLLSQPQPEEAEWLLQDTIIVYKTNPLRAILRSLNRLLSSGSEGSRNLVDSDLPKQLKRIFENAGIFRHRVLAQAINTTSAFVHNEPTSLAVLQELQLPQTLFKALGERMYSTQEVLAAAIGAVGACCLNSAGLEQMTSQPDVLINIVEKAAVTVDPQDLTVQFGSSLDELTRHHPALRPIILKGLMQVVDQTTTKAEAFVPPEEERRQYVYENVEEHQVVTNEPLAAIAKLCKLLTGALSNTALCLDFVGQGGFEKVLHFVDTPCIPIKFSGLDTYGALSKLFRTICSQEATGLLPHLMANIQATLAKTKLFWEGDAPGWKATLDTHDQAIDEQLALLPGLGTRIVLYSDVVYGVSWNSSRLMPTFLKSFEATKGGKFIPELFALHRAAARFHALGVAEGSPQDASTPAPPFKHGPRFLATRLHSNLMRASKAIIRNLLMRRPDAEARVEADAVAKEIALGIKAHLEPQGTEEEIRAVDHVAVSLATLLLFDERGHEGRLSPMVFLQFRNVGGMDAFLNASGRIFSHMDHDFAIPEAERTEAQKHALAHSTANVRIPLLVISSLVTTYPLVDNVQIAALMQTGEKWSTVDAMVKIRLDALPKIHHVWTAPWLTSVSLPTAKAAVRAFVTIMAGGNEEPEEPAPPAAAPVASSVVVVPRQPVVADPARVGQLVDMGFARGSAEHALVRARNNVGAAAELLLTVPHLFPDTPSTTAPAEPAQANAPGEGAAEGDAAQASSSDAADDAPTQDTSAPTETAAISEGTSAAPAAQESVPQPTEAATQAASEITEEHSGMDVDPPASTEPSGESIRKQLDEMRTSLKPSMPERALELLDANEDLVFDLQLAFSTDIEGAKLLLQKALESVRSTGENKDKAISARLRMLAVFIRQQSILLDEETQKLAVEIVSPLQVTSPRPSWTAALLHFIEAVFASSEAVSAPKIGDEPSVPYTPTSVLLGIKSHAAKVAGAILDDEEAQQLEVLAALRTLAVVTRYHHDMVTPDLIEKLLKPFKSTTLALQGLHPYVAMTLRHGLEDDKVLVNDMRREIRANWANTPFNRNQVMEVGFFAEKYKSCMLRNPNAFLEAAEKEAFLSDPTPSGSAYHLRKVEQDSTPAPSSDVFRDNERAKSPVMETLVAALANGGQNTSTSSGVIFSIITEIIGSYIVSKQMFMSAVRKPGLFPGSKNGLANFINETVCKTELSAVVNETESPNNTLSLWGTSLIVALCSDPGAVSKEDLEDLTNVRKTVLDVIVKAIKEPVADPNLRYSRLWALCNLIHRLLTSKCRAPGLAGRSETHIPVARIMLEKGFVGVLTTAAGEVDLNFPGVNAVLSSFLRALDYL